ncbi:MAG: hypothetical protein NZ521_11390 [Flammeovirgaceae bacterium]|nr:hypothetical protein [Flammeovirgaceae bacterium]MDW8287109.1 hypothetical protein [Flammeovirgaceae bacterium]
MDRLSYVIDKNSGVKKALIINLENLETLSAEELEELEDQISIELSKHETARRFREIREEPIEAGNLHFLDIKINENK